MNIFKKTMVALIILVVSAVVVQVVVAETMGFDLVALLQNKVSSVAESSTLPVKSQLEQTKNDTVNGTIGYLDDYINGIKENIESYTEQETRSAKQKITDKGQEIKNILDGQRQNLEDNSKIKIKAKIDSDLHDVLKDIDNDLSIKIQEKLK